MIVDNSYITYVNILEKLSKRRMEVYSIIAHIGPCSNLQVSKCLNLPINCITGRVKELRDIGVVVEDKRAICPETKQMVSYWKVAKNLIR